MTKFKIIGDHSDVHCGCQAVIDSIKHALPVGTVLVDNDDYDILLVNGEGSMHHDTGPFQRKMKDISASLDLGKRVVLINSVWQENSGNFDKVLKRLDGIYVREVMSRDDLILRHGVNSIVQPDLSLQAEIDPAADYVDFKGRRVMTDFYSREFLSFVRMTDGFLKRTAYVDMKRMGWSSFVNSLRTASMLITGRHHAVMAACKARVPFVMLSGNTHKVEGFLKTSGVNIPVCTSPLEIGNVVAWAALNGDAYEDLFDWVDSLPKWTVNI